MLIPINIFMTISFETIINKIMNKAYQFKLKPTEEQTTLLKQHGGACRWLWNYMLDQNINKYDKEQKFIFQWDMNRLVPDLRKEYPWLKDINSQSLQQKNKDLDSALKRKISKKSQCGFPKFKKKQNQSDSFRVPQHFKLSNKGVYLPKIGWVKWKVNRKLTGKAKSITIKQDLHHWIAVVLVELPGVPQRNAFDISEVVGLDVGLKDFVVQSNGPKIPNPKHLKKSEKIVKKRQRILFHKTKGSNQRNKARIDVAKTHRHIRNQRKDFINKSVNEITNQYQVVCMEDLNIQGMVKNYKLAKSISSVGWYQFKNRLQQKLNETGGIMVEIDRFFPSSKMCSDCGCLNKDLTLADRKWICDCGTNHDRDINAALNIRNEGLSRLGTSRIYGCGDTSVGDMAYDISRYVSLKHQNQVVGPEAAEL